MSQAHAAFKFIRQQHIESLKLHVEEYEHLVTGAQHIHLSPQGSDENENVFLVALRTVPQDSTGVAHILEHTALCGSKNYPVRDPFFMMTRRSINTFMNAFTSSDWTAYPFASLNKKDFNNLLDVYLDAVFFSRLDPLDFAQEGHRVEFKEPEDPSSDLEYKGVVFNEMKGAMSSVPSQLWQNMCKYLFPTTTYHFNSGGDPERIPSLTYEGLKDFYKTHYHPSNAIFMTYGDISAKDHQTKFEDQALSHFCRLDYTVSVPNEQRIHSTVRIQESYANSDEDIEEKTHVVMGWLLGQSINLRDNLRAQLLSSVLLDNSASPLMHALESSDLGSAPSPMCGLDTSQKEISLLCGLAGCKADVADGVEKLIVDTLVEIAENGIAQEDVESALHQLELHQREVGGDSYPYGLQLILTSLSNATHRGDPVSLLNIDKELEKLREDTKSPDFVKGLVQQLLLKNHHRIRLTMTPEKHLSERQTEAEIQKLKDLRDSLSEKEKLNIISQTKALKERQAAIDDESILPKVSLSDVPRRENSVDGEKSTINDTPVTQYGAGTNGLVYQQLVYDLPQLDPGVLGRLSLYSSLITELGAGEHNYLDMQRLQARVCGSFNAFSSIRGHVNDAHQIKGTYCYSGKALNRNHAALSDLMQLTIDGARFDEHTRIQELVAQIRNHQEQSVTGNGHALAMAAASAGICASAHLSHQLSGLAGIKAIKELDTALSQSPGMDELVDCLSKLHTAITGNSKQILLIGEKERLSEFYLGLNSFCSEAEKSQSALSLPQHSKKIQQAWITNTQVNFCAKSYATVSSSHEDAAKFAVLGSFLRNGYLHTVIREQGGAYGGGASQDNNTGAFRFYSYRDPRLAETLDDFDKSINWLLNETHSPSKLEEAILGTISNLDNSESPAGRAKRCFHAELHGRTQEHRQIFRERALSTTLDDIRRIAETYLKPEQAHTAIVSKESNIGVAESLGLEIIEL